MKDPAVGSTPSRPSPSSLPNGKDRGSKLEVVRPVHAVPHCARPCTAHSPAPVLTQSVHSPRRVASRPAPCFAPAVPMTPLLLRDASSVATGGCHPLRAAVTLQRLPAVLQTRI